MQIDGILYAIRLFSFILVRFRDWPRTPEIANPTFDVR